MSTNKLFLLSFYLWPAIINLLPAQERVSAPLVKPVLQVDTPFPTSDKPQSKLWYMDNSWWALLPRSSGPSLWQRTSGGWIEHSAAVASLKGIPGRADVWANEREITAVSVDTHFLTVFRLTKKGRGQGVRWKAQVLATLHPPSASDTIETATIVQNRQGHWWVAADAGGKVCVWHALSGGKRWNGPSVLAEGLDKDDICVITRLPEGIGVIWSDQVQEAVRMRVHRDGQPAAHWDELVVIDSGNRTADDHLNTSLSADGTLWVATKNSLDELEAPQLVLRVRSPKGLWRSFPYGLRDTILEPSRPIVVATEDPGIVLTGHTVYNRKNPYWGEIAFGRVDTLQTGLLADKKAVIVPDTTGWTGIDRINDVTGPKKPFLMNVPWIVLASDKDGRVYEADLRRWLYP